MSATNTNTVHNEELANRIIDNNLHQNTKKQYSNKIKHFNAWFIEHHPEFRVSATSTDLNLNAIATTDAGSAALVQFYGHTSQKKNSDGSYINPVQYQSFEHVSGYKSAIKNHFKSKRIQCSFALQAQENEFFKGYKRLIAEEKQDGTRKVRDGKVPLTFQIYRYLARLAIGCRQDFHLGIFSHAFLLLCWNLVARCVSVSSLMFSHITWNADAMIVVFPTTKADQEGKNCSPKHVYANVHHPEICPILSFAIYVFTSGVRRNGASPSVFSDNVDATESRFGGWLRTTCSSADNAEALRQNGIDDAVEIGTHSFRKGVANFLCGMVGGASPIAIYLRAGWSLGPVQSRYILECSGGDQLCGRAATGLDITTNEFASLPPHFDSVYIVSEDIWNRILPGYATFYPPNFRAVLKHLLASLSFHKVWIQSNLNASHPLFNAPVWTTGILNDIHPFVLSGTGRNSTSLLTATGIPPHILLANELAKLDAKVEVMKVEMMVKLEALPDQVKDTMLTKFQINGAIPITPTQIQNMLSEFKTTILAAIQSTHLSQQQQQANDLAQSATNCERSIQTWLWKGRFHPVPQDFVFPTDSITNLWNLWWNGKPVSGIGPYRKLETYDIDKKTHRNFFIKARKVVTFVVSHSGVSVQVIASASYEEQIRLLRDSYNNIYDEWYGESSAARLDKRSLSTMSYLSFYELMKGGGKRKNYGKADDEE
jgi:hypothetical protein